MKRAYFLLAVLPLVMVTVARAGTVTVTPDASSYTVGQLITLTVVGDPQGGSARGIWGRLVYSPGLTNPSGITPTQNTHTFSKAGIASLGPLRQGEGYSKGGYGYSDAFNQVFDTAPVQVDQNTTSVIRLVAAAPGTLNFYWEEEGDGFGNGIQYFDVAPNEPAATVTIPEPGVAVPIALGLVGLLASPRRRGR